MPIISINSTYTNKNNYSKNFKTPEQNNISFTSNTNDEYIKTAFRVAASFFTDTAETSGKRYSTQVKENYYMTCIEMAKKEILANMSALKELIVAEDAELYGKLGKTNIFLRKSDGVCSFDQYSGDSLLRSLIIDPDNKVMITMLSNGKKDPITKTTVIA